MLQPAKIDSLYPKVGRVLENDPNTKVIRYEVTIDKKHVAEFARIVGHSGKTIPPTFYTFFRWGEFTWLTRMNVALESIVHTEQEYSYHADLEPGVTLKVETEVTQFRERRGLKMIGMTTRLSYQNKLVASSQTSFLSRDLGRVGEAK